MKNIIAIFLILSFNQIVSQEILNNQSVLDMIELGFEEQVIIAKIESSTTDFDTSLDKLKELKDKGVTQNVLTAMIKDSNNKTADVNKEIINNKGDDIYEYDGGYGEIQKPRLLKEDYFKDLNGIALHSIVDPIIFKAKLQLKTISSFKIIQIRLYRNNKDKNIAEIYYTGENDYGAAKESVLKGEFNYTPSNLNSDAVYLNGKSLSKEENEDFEKLTKYIQNFDYSKDENRQEFIYEKMIFKGKSLKMKGKVIIGDNYFVWVQDATNYSGKTEMKSPLIKNFINDNKWEFEGVIKGINFKYVYDGNETKYKTDGGVIIMESLSESTIFPLIKAGIKN